ncbi:hypothetical protein MMC21_007584 [Puttea exsequens]|nr:hypothetical protein [Puttea exsequens]
MKVESKKKRRWKGYEGVSSSKEEACKSAVEHMWDVSEYPLPLRSQYEGIKKRRVAKRVPFERITRLKESQRRRVAEG